MLVVVVVIIRVNSVGSDKWVDIVPFTTLQPGYVDSCHNYFKVSGGGGSSRGSSSGSSISGGDFGGGG